MGYHPRTNIVKDEKDYLFTDSHSVLAKWTNHFSQLFVVHVVSDVRQTEIHTAEPLVPESSVTEFEMAIGKLKSHRSPGMDQIRAEIINPYPTAFPYGNGMVLHFYQQQESSTTKTVHKVINKRLKTYV